MNCDHTAMTCEMTGTTEYDNNGIRHYMKMILKCEECKKSFAFLQPSLMVDEDGALLAEIIEIELQNIPKTPLLKRIK